MIKSISRSSVEI